MRKNNQLVASTPTAFTPVLKIGGSVTGITYGRQDGNYVINGNVVTGTINILLTNKRTDRRIDNNRSA